MDRPWFWYVTETPSGETVVKIGSEPRDSIWAREWIIPMATSDDGLWMITLRPKRKWDVNGEWVFKSRERPSHWDCDETCEQCYPPSREPERCEKCGQEIWP